MVAVEDTNQNNIAVTEDCPNAGLVQKQEILDALAKLRSFTCSSTGALGQWTAAELAAMKAELETVKTLMAELGEGDLTQLSQDVQAVRDILAQFDSDGDGGIDAVVTINNRLDAVEGRLTTLEQTQSQHSQAIAAHSQTIANQGQTIQGFNQQFQTLGQQQQANSQAIQGLEQTFTDQICAERRLQASFLEGMGADVDALLSEPCPLPVSVMNPPDTEAASGEDGNSDPSQFVS